MNKKQSVRENKIVTTWYLANSRAEHWVEWQIRLKHTIQ